MPAVAYATGNGSTTAFTMPWTVSNPLLFLSFQDGACVPPTAYTISGTTITYTSAPPNNAQICWRNLS